MRRIRAELPSLSRISQRLFPELGSVVLVITLERAMGHRPSVELLEATHSFPGEYKIKAIGSADDDFEARVVEAVSALLPARSDLDYSVRSTPGGRHLAITLDLTVQTAEQVLAIYDELQKVKGLTHLF